MHIYWLHTHFLLNTGGTRFIYEVIKELKARNISVSVLVERSSQHWKKEYKKIDVTVTEISSLSSNSALYWLFFPVFYVRLYLKLRNVLPQGAVLISSMFPMHVLASHFRCTKIYYCFEPFAFFYDTSLIESYGFIKRALVRLLAVLYSPIDKIGVERADHLLAINPSVGRSIQSTYHRKPDEFTLLGIDTDHFNMQVKSISEKIKDQVILFHSTDYTPLKGTELLIRCLAQVKSKKWKLLISETCEDNKTKTRYLQLLEQLQLVDKVEFLGHLTYADLPRYYRYADIYCFSGDPRSEGATAASMSVLEAQACGLPVVRSTGNDDEVLNGETGFVVSPLEQADYAQAIDLLVEDRALRTKMSKAAVLHVERKYSWEHVGDVIEQSLRKYA